MFGFLLKLLCSVVLEIPIDDASSVNTVATGDTATSLEFRENWEYTANLTVAAELAQQSKGVTLSRGLEGSTRTMQILVRDDTSRVTALQHAGPEGFGPFSSEQANRFVRTISKNITSATRTVDLLGCHVDKTFAIAVEQILQQDHPSVRVRVLVDHPQGNEGLYELRIFNATKQFQIRHPATDWEEKKPISELDAYLTYPQNLNRN
jgi:hypothetical protein